MILTLLLIGIPFILFIVLMFIYVLLDNNHNKQELIRKKEIEDYNLKMKQEGNWRYKTYYKDEYYNERLVTATGWSIVAFILITIIIAIELIVANVNVNVKVKKLEAKRTVLVAKVERLQSGDLINGDLGSLEDTYSQVISFNNKIISHREYSKGKWLNWFYRVEIGNIKEIEL